MKNFLKAVAISLLFCSHAFAQSGTPVKQSGNITPNQVPWWITSGVIGGGVTAADSPISSFGVTGPICSNSARQVSGAWSALCFQANTSNAATISLQNYGTAVPQSLQFVVNGVTYTFPFTPPSMPTLSADTIYYFRTDGNDGNACTGNTAGTACATVKGVLDKAFLVDLNGYNLTLQAGDTGSPHTYNGCATIASPQIGRGTITLVGSVSTPANYILAGSDCGAAFPNGGGAVVRVSNGANLTVKGFKFQTVTTGWALYAYAAQLVAQNVEFGSVAEGHLGVEANGTVLIGDHTISGGGVLHFHAFNGGSMIGTTGGVATLVGTPVFSAYFAGASDGGLLRFSSYSFAGTGAIGTRFLCHLGCNMQVAGDSLTFFPGDQAGVYDQNGFYGSRAGFNNVTIKNDDITSLNIYSNSTTTYPALAMGRNEVQEWIASIATAGASFFTGTSPGDSVLFSLGHDMWLGKAGSLPSIHITGTGVALPQALTYGGVTLANAVAGVGSMALATEGTWTPVLSTDATPGTPAYSIQVGSYERIGRQVTARFSISLSGWTGSPTGNITITGLPLAATSTSGDNGSCTIGTYSVAGLAASNIGITGTVNSGTSAVALRSSSNTISNVITAAQAGTTPILIGMCNYRV